MHRLKIHRQRTTGTKHIKSIIYVFFMKIMWFAGIGIRCYHNIISGIILKGIHIKWEQNIGHFSKNKIYAKQTMLFLKIISQSHITFIITIPQQHIQIAFLLSRNITGGICSSRRHANAIRKHYILVQ